MPVTTAGEYLFGSHDASEGDAAHVDPRDRAQAVATATGQPAALLRCGGILPRCTSTVYLQRAREILAIYLPER